MTIERDRVTAAIEKKRAVKVAESEGMVADSLDVRMALMARVRAGEISLERAQSELRKIQATAKINGLMTRAQAFNGG